MAAAVILGKRRGGERNGQHRIELRTAVTEMALPALSSSRHAASLSFRFTNTYTNHIQCSGELAASALLSNLPKMNFLIFQSARFAPKAFNLLSGVIFLIESREVTQVSKLMTQLQGLAAPCVVNKVWLDCSYELCLYCVLTLQMQLILTKINNPTQPCSQESQGAAGPCTSNTSTLGSGYMVNGRTG